MVKSRDFELLPNDHNFLPDWIDDNDLKNSPTETLGSQEEEFWVDLINKYLEPIEPTDEEKVRAHNVRANFARYNCHFDVVAGKNSKRIG